MTDRPIIFSAPMVRALLDGRKTQTRRILKPQPVENSAGLWVTDFGKKGWPQIDAESVEDSFLFRDALPYAPGDRLWVRENWNSSGLNWGKPIRDMRECQGGVHYAATDDGEWKQYWGGWKPSIHMPRWASRLTLVVTDVRVQRLQDISEADAVAEGALQPWTGSDPESDTRTALNEFEALWNSIHGPEAWDANHWVVAVSFAVHRCNIDKMEARND